jgi:hypothetical protein
LYFKPHSFLHTYMQTNMFFYPPTHHTYSCHENTPTESCASCCQDLFLPNNEHDDELFRVLLNIFDKSVHGDDPSSSSPSRLLQPYQEDAHSRTSSPAKKSVKNSNDSFTKICSKLSLPRDTAFQHVKDKMEIDGLFSLPIRQVASILSVSESSLKRLCRKMNITRWPYRKKKYR